MVIDILTTCGHRNVRKMNIRWCDLRRVFYFYWLWLSTLRFAKKKTILFSFGWKPLFWVLDDAFLFLSISSFTLPKHEFEMCIAFCIYWKITNGITHLWLNHIASSFVKFTVMREQKAAKMSMNCRNNRILNFYGFFQGEHSICAMPFRYIWFIWNYSYYVLIVFNFNDLVN